jgi:hypothetical protein
MTNIAASIIEKFGGINPMARALNHRNASTVQGWKECGYIPARQQPRVLRLARSLGIPLMPEDFFDLTDIPPLPEPAHERAASSDEAA